MLKKKKKKLKKKIIHKFRHVEWFKTKYSRYMNLFFFLLFFFFFVLHKINEFISMNLFSSFHNDHRHICLAHHDSAVGKSVNPWTFSLLRYWLKSVFVPVDRKFSVVKSVIHHSNKVGSIYQSMKLLSINQSMIECHI